MRRQFHNLNPRYHPAHRAVLGVCSLAALLFIGELAEGQVVKVPPPEVPPTATTTVITGRLAGVQGSKLNLVLERNATAEIAVPEQARILLNGKLAGVEDLQQGDTLRVTVNEANPKVALRVIAARLVVTTPPAEPPTAGNAPPPQPPPRPVPRRPATAGVTLTPTPTAGAALVANVTAKGPGAVVGIQPGDYVTAVDRKPVPAMQTAQDLSDIVPNKRPGDKVLVAIWRNGETRNLEVTLRPTEEVPTAPGDVRSPLDVNVGGVVWVAKMIPQGKMTQSGFLPGDTIRLVEQDFPLTPDAIVSETLGMVYEAATKIAVEEQRAERPAVVPK